MKNAVKFLSLIGLLCAGCSFDKAGRQLRDSSERVESASRQLKDVACKIARLESRNGSAEQSLGATDWQGLFRSSAGGVEKMVYASAVVRAMPFQNWDSVCDETEESLQSDYVASIRILAGLIHDRLPESQSVSTSTWDPFADSNWNALGALGASLDEVDPNLQRALNGLGRPAFSLYDLIYSGLELEEAYNRGDKIPDYAVEVLKWKPEFSHLLQLRHNFLSSLIVVLSTDAESSWLSEGQLFFYPREIPLVEPGKASVARLRTYHDWIRKVATTRADLKSLGQRIDVNNWIGRALMNIKWTPSLNVVSEELSRLQNDFIQTYSEMVAENVEVLGLKERRVESPELVDTPWLAEGFQFGSP